jgi:CRISPR-associated endonuclease/helicase Cas3
MDKREARLFILEAPMGEGKTEAALYLASHLNKNAGKSGFYIAMPTTATGNQMWIRMNALLDAHQAGHSRLLHGMAWLVEETEPADNAIDSEDSETACEWLQPLRRAMLSQYGVGTVDQAMMAAMPVKYGALRLLGLTGKTLVIDEIHAYDTYMSTIIETLLSWCSAMNIPVILLSATLPAKKRKELIQAYGVKTEEEPLRSEYPLITAVNEDRTVVETPVRGVYMRRSFQIRTERILGDTDKTAERVLGLPFAGCVCVMLNTVERAQEVYRKLREAGFPGTLKLFHARFPAEARQRIEDECMALFGKNGDRRPESAVLVCTQVVEQSLDLDFDFMITELAPIDLLLQRLGRLFRHWRIRPRGCESPAAEILLCDAERYAKFLPMYRPKELRRTERLLETRPELRIPEMMRELIEYAYSPDPKSEDREAEGYQKIFMEAHEAALAKKNSLPTPDPFLGGSFVLNNSGMIDLDDNESAFFLPAQTRLADPSLRVALVPEALIAAAGKDPYNKDTAREILMKSVTIPEKLLPGLEEEAQEKKFKKGLLRGYLLLPSENGVYSWTKGTITSDDERGVLVEKK